MEKGALTKETLFRMGAMMAKLHEASSDFIPSAGFARPSLNVQSFKRDWEHLSLHCRHFIADDAAFGLYAGAAAKVADHLRTFAGDRTNYGMIHADMHIGNIVFRDGEPYPIDFGRCGFGYHLYDIAQSIMGLYPQQRAQFMEGYGSVRQTDEGAIPQLETFFIMAIIEAYSFHSENPLETESLIAEQPYAQALLRAYLDGASFLFQPFEGE